MLDALARIRAIISRRQARSPSRSRWPRLVWSCLLIGALHAMSDHTWAEQPSTRKPSLDPAPTEAELRFARDIQPLLARKCLACHGADRERLEGGLDLASATGLKHGGDSGEPLIVLAQPETSPLYRAILRTDEGWSAMPPKENDRLTADEQASVLSWIAAGAVWPEPERLAELRILVEATAAGVRVRTSGGLDADWTNRRYQPAALWAYQPLAAPSGMSLDEQLMSSARSLELAPAPIADRRTLIRRVTFDLTGLPPSTAEIEAYVADPREDHVVDDELTERLLASPHYGERMAQHWLDLTRYADSAGFANDYERGNAWRYRDYVVRAFNQDKPYDEFLLEQIAGDEWAEELREQGVVDTARLDEAVLATGFLRMGPWELTGMEVARIARQRFLDDVTDIVGQVFLGQMLQCARCHDHKFDPVPTRDYYAIQACFATTQLVERPVPFLPTENQAGFEERDDLLRREAGFLATLKAIDERSIKRAREWLMKHGHDPEPFETALREAREQGGRGRLREIVYDSVRGRLQQRKLPEDQVPPRHIGFTPQEFGEERVARKGLERLAWVMDRYGPYAHGVYSGATPNLTAVYAPLRLPQDRWAGELEASHLLAGGDPFSLGPAVTPGVLSAACAPELTDEARAALIPQTRERRRLALARWIADPANPLTARVIANRVWQWHFGRPLAGNPNNFGGTGKPPTHPALLDDLARFLIDHDWSIKALHRHILRTTAYRRSTQHPQTERLAERDPLSTSYLVFPPRRLTAEELRDAMLAATGELNRTLGGIPVRPEIHREAAEQPRQVMGTFAEVWQPSRLPEQRHRRSLYVLKLRGLRDPFAEVFNSPTHDLSCEARDSSTVVPQALALLNSESVATRALVLAARIDAESSDPDAAVAAAFLRVLGRAPTPEETKLARQTWERQTARHATWTPTRQPLATRIVREAIEENTGEAFTFVEELGSVRPYVPDLHPADVPATTRGLADLCLVLFNTHEFAYVY